MLVRPTTYAELSLGETLLDLAVRFIVNCPPEDLNSSERLFFQIEEAHWFYDDFARAQNPLLPHMKIKLFVKSLFQTCPYLQSLNSDPLSALLQFQNYKRGIPVRGAIILNKGLNKVLMVRGWKGSHWTYPRGKINKDEPDDLCAIREVYEETGFDISPYLVKDDYIEVTREGKNIRLYVIAGVPEDTQFETQTRKEISKIAWHALRSLPGYTSNPGATASNAAKYYTTMPFNRSLRRYVAKAKGLVASLSNSESAALKSLLGVAGGSKPVRNDEEAAKHLLTLLHSISGSGEKAHESEVAIVDSTTDRADDLSPDDLRQKSETPVELSSDRQVLLSLLKSGAGNSATHEIESAQQILGLLNQEIATETALKEVAPVVIDTPSAAKPAVPPNWMLESLVASRKSTTKTTSQSSDSNLLSILKPKPSQGLMSLLQSNDSITSTPNATTSRLPTAGNSASESLLNLLGVDSQLMSHEQSPTPTPEAERGTNTTASQSLLNLLEEDESKPEVESAVLKSSLDDKNILSRFIEATSRSTPAPEVQPSAAEHLPVVDRAVEQERAPAAAALMSLLGNSVTVTSEDTENSKETHEPAELETKPEGDNETSRTEENNQSEFLMSLLRGSAQNQEPGRKPAATQASVASHPSSDSHNVDAQEHSKLSDGKKQDKSGESKASFALLNLLSEDSALPEQKAPQTPAETSRTDERSSKDMSEALMILLLKPTQGDSTSKDADSQHEQRDDPEPEPEPESEPFDGVTGQPASPDTSHAPSASLLSLLNP